MKLRRDENNAMLFGVCSGLAKATDVDVALWRAVMIFGCLLTGGAVAVAYVVLAIAMPVDE